MALGDLEQAQVAHPLGQGRPLWTRRLRAHPVLVVAGIGAVVIGLVAVRDDAAEEVPQPLSLLGGSWVLGGADPPLPTILPPMLACRIRQLNAITFSPPPGRAVASRLGRRGCWPMSRTNPKERALVVELTQRAAERTRAAAGATRRGRSAESAGQGAAGAQSLSRASSRLLRAESSWSATCLPSTLPSPRLARASMIRRRTAFKLLRHPCRLLMA
jgi:hypothetical protein